MKQRTEKKLLARAARGSITEKHGKEVIRMAKKVDCGCGCGCVPPGKTAKADKKAKPSKKQAK